MDAVFTTKFSIVIIIVIVSSSAVATGAKRLLVGGKVDLAVNDPPHI
jgi:hypothetical protein